MDTIIDKGKYPVILYNHDKTKWITVKDHAEAIINQDEYRHYDFNWNAEKEKALVEQIKEVEKEIEELSKDVETCNNESCIEINIPVVKKTNNSNNKKNKRR